MDMFEQVKKSIQLNQYISPEVRNDIMQLMEVFSKKLPDIDLANFNDRIKSLKIFSGNKFIYPDAVTYDASNNILLINRDELNKSDAQNRLMYGLLSIITAKDNYWGFNENNQLEALNIGVTEMIVDYLVGSEY